MHRRNKQVLQGKLRNATSLPSILSAPARLAVSMFILTVTAFTASGQAFPSAGNNTDLYLGSGYTTASSDYAQDHIHGISVIGGFRLRSNLAEESQFMRLNDPKSSLIETSLITGIRYSVKYHAVSPFIKGGAGIGFIANPSATLVVLSAGGGVDLTLTPIMHLRADYQYQSWPGELGFQSGLVAKMVTVGIVYHLHPLDRPRVY